MEMTEFNIIINFFSRGPVHILKKYLPCYTKMGEEWDDTSKKSQEQDWISPSLSYSVPKMKPGVKCTLNFRTWIWRNISVLQWWRFINCRSANTIVRSWGAGGVHILKIPGLNHLQTSTREKEICCSLPPNLFSLKNTRCSNPKPPCLQQSQFDCRCFIFLVHHTNNSWPCAIIACFSLTSPPSAAIYIQGCAALITEPFVTNAFQDG